jgi:hypothetical protein
MAANRVHLDWLNVASVATIRRVVSLFGPILSFELKGKRSIALRVRESRMTNDAHRQQLF